MHRVAGRHVARVAHDASVAALDDAVAARDGGQRTHRLQRARQTTQLQGIALHASRDRGLQARMRIGQLLAQQLQPALRPHRLQHRAGVAQVGRVRLQPLLPGRLQPAQRFVATPRMRQQARLRPLRVEPQRGAVGTLGKLAQVVGLQRRRTTLQPGHALAEVDPANAAAYREKATKFFLNGLSHPLDAADETRYNGKPVDPLIYLPNR